MIHPPALRLKALLDSSTPFNRGFSNRVVTVTFDVVKDAPIGETPITFDGSGSFSDRDANSLDGVYTDGVVSIKSRVIVGAFAPYLFQSSSLSLPLYQERTN